MACAAFLYGGDRNIVTASSVTIFVMQGVPLLGECHKVTRGLPSPARKMSQRDKGCAVSGEERCPEGTEGIVSQNKNGRGYLP